MNLEIHNPALERRVREQIGTGRFGDAEDLIEQALDALNEKQSTAPCKDAVISGLGMFGSDQDAALLDEVVRLAYEERRRPAPNRA